MANPIVIAAYDSNWPALFARLRDRVAAALGELMVTIEHIGSTSVPGLAAKPIVDMEVVVASVDEVPAAIERLATLGYGHQGEKGVPGREAFTSPPGLPGHHLYLCALDSDEYRRQTLFRDYLRAHPEEANAYAALKQSLAERFGCDREGYTEAKTDFVRQILRRAAAETTGTQSEPAPTRDKNRLSHGLSRI